MVFHKNIVVHLMFIVSKYFHFILTQSYTCTHAKQHFIVTIYNLNHYYSSCQLGKVGTFGKRNLKIILLSLSANFVESPY